MKRTTECEMCGKTNTCDDRDKNFDLTPSHDVWVKQVWFADDTIAESIEVVKCCRSCSKNIEGAIKLMKVKEK